MQKPLRDGSLKHGGHNVVSNEIELILLVTFIEGVEAKVLWQFPWAEGEHEAGDEEEVDVLPLKVTVELEIGADVEKRRNKVADKDLIGEVEPSDGDECVHHLQLQVEGRKQRKLVSLIVESLYQEPHRFDCLVYVEEYDERNTSVNEVVKCSN